MGLFDFFSRFFKGKETGAPAPAPDSGSSIHAGTGNLVSGDITTAPSFTPEPKEPGYTSEIIISDTSEEGASDVQLESQGDDTSTDSTDSSGDSGGWDSGGWDSGGSWS